MGFTEYLPILTPEGSGERVRAPMAAQNAGCSCCSVLPRQPSRLNPLEVAADDALPAAASMARRLQCEQAHIVLMSGAAIETAAERLAAGAWSAGALKAAVAEKSDSDLRPACGEHERQARPPQRHQREANSGQRSDMVSGSRKNEFITFHFE